MYFAEKILGKLFSKSNIFILYQAWTDLMWSYTVGVEVWVAGGRVNGVLVKIFTDVLCCGLRQQSVDTLPEEQQGRFKDA